MRALVEALCSDECAGRRSGTPGGVLARSHVMSALREAGADPYELAAPRCDGANVVAALPGSIDRWVLVAAHYDHLGQTPSGIYRGADDNAASVAVLAELTRSLCENRPNGRGVLVVAFDGEEPPYFATENMGSYQFVRDPVVPLERIDMMVSMELLGHAIGPAGVPDAVRRSVFALGAERSEGTSARIDALGDAGDGVTVRRADATVIPPLSDHLAFWEAGVPFLLLTGTRSETYHTTYDTPARLDYGRLASVSSWLDRFVRDQCTRPEARVNFLKNARDDRSTLATLTALLDPLSEVSPLADQARGLVRALEGRCDARGHLSEGDREATSQLIGMIEQALAG